MPSTAAASAAPRTRRRTARAGANPFVTPKLFRFLRELAANNDRAWFAANKQRYLDEVRDPLLGLIDALGPGLHRISAHLIADPSPVGGSLFRIYRDTRFSKDKSPYKTHAGVHFRHADGGDVHAPGLYLHLEPRSVFTASGMWRPDSGALRLIRNAMVAQPERWKRATSGRRFQLDEGDRLARPPRGYDPDHPLIEDLKRKSFTAGSTFTQQRACAADFPDRLVESYARTAPLMEFLSRAVGLTW